MGKYEKLMAGTNEQTTRRHAYNTQHSTRCTKIVGPFGGVRIARVNSFTSLHGIMMLLNTDTVAFIVIMWKSIASHMTRRLHPRCLEQCD